MISYLASTNRVFPSVFGKSECDCEETSHRNYRSCSWVAGTFRFSFAQYHIGSGPNLRYSRYGS